MSRFYPWLPPGYYMDRSETNLQVLRRPDGSTVVAFFPEAAMEGEVRHAADTDCQEQEQKIEEV